MLLTHDICIFIIDVHGRSQTIPPSVMASSAIYWLKLGVFGFLPTTHAKIDTTQMCPWSLPSMRRFTYVYLHAKTVVDAGDIRTWQTTVILIKGKTQRPPIWAPCRNQDGAGSGIFRVYLWYSFIYFLAVPGWSQHGIQNHFPDFPTILFGTWTYGNGK